MKKPPPAASPYVRSTLAVAAVDDEVRARGHTLADVIAHPLLRRLGDQRAVGGLGSRGAPTFYVSIRPGALAQPSRRSSPLPAHRDGYRHAAFAGRAVAAPISPSTAWSRSASGITTPWFLAPPKAWARFPCAAPSIDVVGDIGGADEADRCDVGMVRMASPPPCRRADLVKSPPGRRPR